VASSRRGVWLVLILISLAVMVSVVGLMFVALLGGTPAPVPSNATLYLELRAPLPEVEQADIFSALSDGAPTLRQTIDMIGAAKDDDIVTTVYHRLGFAGHHFMRELCHPDNDTTQRITALGYKQVETMRIVRCRSRARYEMAPGRRHGRRRQIRSASSSCSRATV